MEDLTIDDLTKMENKLTSMVDMIYTPGKHVEKTYKQENGGYFEAELLLPDGEVFRSIYVDVNIAMFKCRRNAASWIVVNYLK